MDPNWKFTMSLRNSMQRGRSTSRTQAVSKRPRVDLQVQLFIILAVNFSCFPVVQVVPSSHLPKAVIKQVRRNTTRSPREANNKWLIGKDIHNRYGCSAIQHLYVMTQPSSVWPITRTACLTAWTGPRSRSLATTN
jgi:hypothetical protein